MSTQFADRLRIYRLAAGLTQVELARAIGLRTEGYISKLEAGRKAPSLDLVVRLAHTLGVSFDMLIMELPSAGASMPDSQKQPLPVRPRGPLEKPTEDKLRRGYGQLFGEKLRHLRMYRELTQVEVARRLGRASPTYISTLESGVKLPSLDAVRQVAVMFEVSTDYLLCDEIPVESELRKRS